MHLAIAQIGRAANRNARVDKVYAIDSVPERLEQAKKLGAIPINLNDDPIQKIKDATEGRGADVVMECVGTSEARTRRTHSLTLMPSR